MEGTELWFEVEFGMIINDDANDWSLVSRSAG